MKYYNIINIHFTDKCNYRCAFCFADKNNIELDFDSLKQTIDACEKYFKRNKIINPRINLVGGEPLLYNKINEIIDYIFSKKITCSIITNGYLLDEKFLQDNKGKIDTIGISIDSLNNTTNIQMGRCTYNNQLLSKEKYIWLCSKIKEYEYNLKINVCVSKFNYQEIDDFKSFLSSISNLKFRLKFMKMIVVSNKNPNAITYQISDEEFELFCSNLSSFNPEIENENKMYSKYLMIDSKGNTMIHDHTGKIITIGNVIENYLYLNMANKCLKIVQSLLNKKYSGNKFYKVKIKFGHVGKNYYTLIDIPVYAQNPKRASEIAIQIPRVKHDAKDVVHELKEISMAEYEDLMIENALNPYLICENIQDQRSFKDLNLDIYKENNTNITKKKDKAIKKFKQRKNKSFIRSIMDEIKYYL